ncbi:MAG: SMP-30/gluconolactonase/LRE family protein [Casimicrobiaceae bacterium]
MTGIATQHAACVEPVTETRAVLGESALWCTREQCLYWVDIRAPALHRFAPHTGAATHWPLPDLCGAVALSSGQRLLLAMRTGVFWFDTATDRLEPLLAPEPESLGNRLNDSKCDRRGRLWSGSMRDYGEASTGSLYRIDADLACVRMLGGITVPNALAWSPDDRTLYFADTPDGCIRAYDFDADEGTLGHMRVLVANGVLPGMPDGATVDADGCLWNARYEGGCVARITPQGRIDRRIDVPASRVTSCAFGGADLRTLFITTARQKLSADELRAQPDAGALFSTRLDVGGLPEPRFAA